MTDTKMGNFNHTVKIFSYLVAFILGVAIYFLLDIFLHAVVAVIIAVALVMFASFFRFGGKKKTKGDDRKQD